MEMSIVNELIPNMDDDSHEVNVPKKPIRLKKGPRNFSLGNQKNMVNGSEESKNGGYLKKEMYKNDKYSIYSCYCRTKKTCVFGICVE